MTRPSSLTERVSAALRLDGIRNRIVVLALIATLAPALGNRVLSNRQHRQSVAGNLSRELPSRGSQAAREVDLWVALRSYDVRALTGSVEVSESLDRIGLGGADATGARDRLRNYLVDARGRFGDYDELVVTDADGLPLVSSEATAGRVALLDDWPLRLARGETVLGEPAWDEARSRMTATLASPVLGDDGRLTGVLTAALAFDAVGELLRSVAPGEGGRVDLVGEDGLLIASSDPGSGPAGDERVNAEILATLTDEVVELVDRTGASVVGTLTTVPGRRWAVVVQIPTAEAFAQVDELRSSANLLVSLLLVVAGGLAYLLGGVIVRPLVRLAEGAEAVGEGDLSVDLPEAGGGEVGYLTRAFNDMVGRMRKSRDELAERTAELERLSVTDLLTGLWNRRFLMDAFDREIGRSDRHERPFSVLMIDVDHFKRYNDRHGHLAGDQVLARVARVIGETVRDVDVTARYGGEEFTVLMPECSLESAIRAAERIRANLSKEAFEGGPLTISVGVSEFPVHGETPSELIRAADEGLYEAKRLGRDQVSGPPGPAPYVDAKEIAAKRKAAAVAKGFEPKLSEGGSGGDS